MALPNCHSVLTHTHMMSATMITHLLSKLMVFYSSLPVTRNKGQALMALAHAHDLYAFCNKQSARDPTPIDIDIALDMMQAFEALTQAIQTKFTSSIPTLPS